MSHEFRSDAGIHFDRSNVTHAGQARSESLSQRLQRQNTERSQQAWLGSEREDADDDTREDAPAPRAAETQAESDAAMARAIEANRAHLKALCDSFGDPKLFEPKSALRGAVPEAASSNAANAARRTDDEDEGAVDRARRENDERMRTAWMR